MERQWCNKTTVLFCGVLFLVYFAYALFMPVDDCDETYNYWEPMHYLLYGQGLKTWEWSSQFALRSWFYVWLHAYPGKLLILWAPWLNQWFPLQSLDLLLVHLFGSEWSLPSLQWDAPIIVYFSMRILNAAVTSLAFSYFLSGVRQCFGGSSALYTFAVLVSASSMAHTANSVLPSSFAMRGVAGMGGCWLRLMARQRQASPKASTRWAVRGMVFFPVFAVVPGWPFAALSALIPALWALRFHAKRAVVALLVSLMVLCPLTAGFDFYYYCRSTVSFWNIVAYNVLGQQAEKGAHLFGTEPWYFFFLNLTASFNAFFWLAFALPVSLLGSRHHVATGTLANALWIYAAWMLPFLFWLFVPHKEGRFIVPSYPFIALSAGLAMDFSFTFPWGALSSRRGRGNLRLPRLLLLLTAMLLGLSRSASFYAFYGGPQRSVLHAYRGLEHYAQTHAKQQAGALAPRQPTADGDPWLICMMENWDRFPSHFFLPSGWSYRFLPMDSGILPVPFINTESRAFERGSCYAHEEMNDQNMPFPLQFVQGNPKDQCRILFGTQNSILSQHADFLLPLATEKLLNFRTPRIFRFTIIPGLTMSYAQFDVFGLFTQASYTVEETKG